MVYKRVKLIQSIVILIIATAIFFSSISHVVASRLNFQGRLTDQQGNPLEGTYNIKFSIYPSSDPNSSPLWTEEHANVNASKGIVNILLGSIQSFDEPVKVTFDQERYLGITIDCDHDPNTKEPEMTPRQRILPAIYAYIAGTAYNADIASNADKLDGKDSSEFTTPEKDAGRPGVVENIYEGNVRLMDKYIQQTDLGQKGCYVSYTNTCPTGFSKEAADLGSYGLCYMSNENNTGTCFSDWNNRDQCIGGLLYYTPPGVPCRAFKTEGTSSNKNYYITEMATKFIKLGTACLCCK